MKPKSLSKGQRARLSIMGGEHLSKQVKKHKKKTKKKKTKTEYDVAVTPKQLNDMSDIPEHVKEDLLKDPRQEMFCWRYVELGKIVDAAIASGYAKETAKSYAYVLVKTPHIQKRITQILTACLPKDSKDFATKAMHDIMVDSDQRAQDRVKAADQLAKMGGWHSPQEVDVTMKEKPTLHVLLRSGGTNANASKANEAEDTTADEG